MGVPDVCIKGVLEYTRLLDERTQSFLATLHRTFESRRQELLKLRDSRQIDLDNGVFPDFLRETESIRKDVNWKGPPPAPGLVDRRVEITGPVDRKMVINALNCGANTYMADFEDSNAPTWENCMNGQVNLRDAVHKTISYDAPNGKCYQLNETTAVLLVRPRGWHLVEKHFLVDGQPISASVFDFGIYFYHNARKLIENGSGPYFYLPKIEGYLEARLWNDVFNLAQDYVGIARGTIRATVLIETILAAFEMEEIIFELRDHSAGLNCGRWDYIFSVIKKFRNHRRFVLPDRSSVTMTVPFMQAYVDLLVQTCHKRGVHAMGGMAAQIPIKGDPAANELALAKVRADKLREVKAGHDGTWVAHPALVPIAKQVFDENMSQPNQLGVCREGHRVSAGDLLNTQVSGSITEAGLRSNISVALCYMESWLRGIGCVPINNLMEDAATAEIARSQIWQWIHHGCLTDSGFPITLERVRGLVDQEAASFVNWEGSKFPVAKAYLMKLIEPHNWIDFLTVFCYDDLVLQSLGVML